mmetsp:Transcript_14290/g.35511  ORF Transcript_14290/g.35511 Transcript_14290/m.35511 type:complete len:216 (+) Transcript_14290:3063-3710(+)
MVHSRCLFSRRARWWSTCFSTSRSCIAWSQRRSLIATNTPRTNWSSNPLVRTLRLRCSSLRRFHRLISLFKQISLHTMSSNFGSVIRPSRRLRRWASRTESSAVRRRCVFALLSRNAKMRLAPNRRRACTKLRKCTASKHPRAQEVSRCSVRCCFFARSCACLSCASEMRFLLVRRFLMYRRSAIERIAWRAKVSRWACARMDFLLCFSAFQCRT